MTRKALVGAGLRGQSAGETSLCTVGQSGSGLTYRGYDISDLAAGACFEEVAYLLLRGKLPNAEELDAYRTRLRTLRSLPSEVKAILELIPRSTHPMEVMRTGCSILGNLEPENGHEHQVDVANRLLAAFPAIVNYWYRFSHDGVRISTETQPDSLAGHFLEMLLGHAPSARQERVLDISMILYAEHEFNASTFTARVCASTLSDMHSCISAAIGSLRGPLHGGANEAAMELIEKFHSPEEAVAEIEQMLDRQELIMGFGHAIYRESDPRNDIIKGLAQSIAEGPAQERLFQISSAIEETMWKRKRLFANADFFHAAAYHFLGIPTKIFTPIFVCARVAGWAAHVIEQRSNNRIIRPSATYVGESPRPFPAIADR